MNRIKIFFIFGVFVIIFIAFILYPPITQKSQALSFNSIYPTFGLYCSEANVIQSGAEKFDLTNLDLLSKEKAIKLSEYKASGKGLIEFQIPFLSSFAEIPSFNVSVNGTSVKGEVWFGANTSYVNMYNLDNSIIVEQLKKTYSPILDDKIKGELYTVYPDNDAFTVTANLNEGYKYIFDSINKVSDSYSPNGIISWNYNNALSQSNYQFFFIGETPVRNFTASCYYEKQTISFKSFIDLNYNTNINFYQELNVPIESLYAIGNKIIDTRTSMTYADLFVESINKTTLNAYKFKLLLDGDAIIKYSTEVTAKISNRFEPTGYMIGQKQLNNCPTDYSVTLSNEYPFIIESSKPVQKLDKTYFANSSEDFYFIINSSEAPLDKQNYPNQNKIKIYIGFGISLIISIVLLLSLIITSFRKKLKK